MTKNKNLNWPILLKTIIFHFWGSGMTCELYGSHKQDPIAGHSWPKKMAIFDKIGHKKIQILFFGQNFDMSKFFECQSIHSGYYLPTWLISDRNMSKTWQVSLYNLVCIILRLWSFDFLISNSKCLTDK